MKFEDQDRSRELPPYAPGEGECGPSRAVSPPAARPPRTSVRNYLAIFLTLLGVGLFAVLLFGCSGGNPAVLVLLLGIGGFMLLHYLVWGWWLERVVMRKQEKDHDP